MDRYSEHTNWEMVSQAAEKTAADAGLRLAQSERGLLLTDGRLELVADLMNDLHRLESGNLYKELIVRAALGRKSREELLSEGRIPIAVDATAGLGEDSLLLAAAGYMVHLYEANPVIAALLHDALKRAGETNELSSVISRMELHFGDSIHAMQNLTFRPDLILLDPMFPARQKSALVKKKFQLLKSLERPCGNEEALFQAACQASPKKILIKRPAKGPYLAGRKPSYSIEGKTIRCDVIIFPENL